MSEKIKYETFEKLDLRVATVKSRRPSKCR